ncbi:hypothetical protein FACS1894102_3490 [Spirochaetia bacterium]|nr:hypothetical protein FACS1894102_3490 [Spirochaetia bacterium]
MENLVVDFIKTYGFQVVSLAFFVYVFLSFKHIDKQFEQVNKQLEDNTKQIADLRADLSFHEGIEAGRDAMVAHFRRNKNPKRDSANIKLQN